MPRNLHRDRHARSCCTRRRCTWGVSVLAALIPALGFAQSLPDGTLARYPGNPLLTKGEPGSYDQLKIGPRAILREAPNVWKMWYEAAPGGNQSATAYATSSDGLVWTKYPGNPVMSPSEPWEGVGGTNREDSPTTVLKEGGVYKLWYHGISDTTRQIGYAESSDGLSWTKYAGNPVLQPGPAGAWDSGSICEPRVVHTGAQYYMFYTRCIGSSGIGLATSPDGKSWTKYAGNPVLTTGSGNSWDSLQVSWGEVYHDGQRFFMWYPGKSSNTSGFSLGLATSSDGRVWMRSANNPVMTPPSQALGKGDDLGVESSPSVIRMGNTMRVYYGGFRFCCPEDTTVCLATTPATGVANRAPIVDAGADRTISLGMAAALDGTVMDDDTPAPLAIVRATWSKISGPGSVTFASPTSLDTTASFSAPGSYALALTASDTALTTTDSVTIDVLAGGPDAGGGTGDARAGSGGTGGQGGSPTGTGGATTDVPGGRAEDAGSAGAGGGSDVGGQTDAPENSTGTGGTDARDGARVDDAGASSTPRGASSSGCGCSTVPRTPPTLLLVLAGAFVVVWRRLPKR
jgi:predicted GH43/DUF377 family glycosyl hydrolase